MQHTLHNHYLSTFIREKNTKIQFLRLAIFTRTSFFLWGRHIEYFLFACVCVCAREWERLCECMNLCVLWECVRCRPGERTRLCNAALFVSGATGFFTDIRCNSFLGRNSLVNFLWYDRFWNYVQYFQYNQVSLNVSLHVAASSNLCPAHPLGLEFLHVLLCPSSKEIEDNTTKINANICF